MTMEEVMKGDFEHMIRSKGMVDGVLVDIILDRQINGMFRYAVRITRTDGTYGYSYKPFDTLFFAKRYFDRLLKENPGVVRMKKKIIVLICMLLLSVGLLSGCIENNASTERGVFGNSDCNALLIKPNSSFTINGILHSIHGMNNYLFGQEAKMIYVGNKSYFPYIIEVESFERYIGLNVTLNCDYIYYDDKCGKTGYHVRIKYPVIIMEEG